MSASSRITESYSILCIDDDPAILALRKHHLERKGYEVLQAQSGPEGVALLTVREVDCVLLDYNMPGMNGDRVAREIKRLRPAIPVLLVSGGTVPEDVLLWVDGILTKDSLPSQLLERVESLLLGEPARDIGHCAR